MMGKVYEVLITETIQRSFNIEATSPWDATDKAAKLYLEKDWFDLGEVDWKDRAISNSVRNTVEWTREVIPE